MRPRLLYRGLAAIAFALSATALLAGPASAAFTTPEYETTFSGADDHAIGSAVAVAVDEATHDVYVADAANRRVEKFDSEGNFLFMFGDGVDSTHPGNQCPAQPGDACQPGQEGDPDFPDFTHPTAIAVDNSGGPSSGSVYVAEGTAGGGSGSIWRFDSSGDLDARWGSGGGLTVPLLLKMTVSPFTGDVWALDSYATSTVSGRVSSYTPAGSQRFIVEEEIIGGGDGDFAVDSDDHFWVADQNGYPLKADIARFPENNRHALGRVIPTPVRGFATNPETSDVLTIANGEQVLVFERTCEPAKGYCSPKGSFGAGQLSDPRALAVDGSNYSVYVAVEGGVAAFRSKLVPDVVPKPTRVGRVDALLSAHLDPHGGGDITGCVVEYGESDAYGSTAPCEQPLPLGAPADVTVHLTNLVTETPYHFRFVASNANGSSFGPDRVFTPHWVTGLETGEATEIDPGGALLHGELNPEGEATHYYFEWGETKQYGQLTPALPGELTSAPNLTSVAVPLDRLLTGGTTYHYRLVAVNGLGTSYGADREFTTTPADAPQVRNLIATPNGPVSAVLRAEINPGFGDTDYRFQYGDSSYGHSTVIAGPVGNDGTFHPVSAEIGGLSPATTYHYRVIAFNFNGYVASPDQTFTTPGLPTAAATPLALPVPPPATTPRKAAKRCPHGKVRRHGRCVKKRRGHRGHKRGGRRGS
jgi:hypothetical protein